MFAYCTNNPVTFSDPTGEIGILWWLSLIAMGASVVGGLTGCSAETEPQTIYNAAPLTEEEMRTGSFNCYNTDCFGVAIGKKTCLDIPGYQRGDDAMTVFGLMQDALGQENVRLLDSIDSPIHDNEYRILLMCGADDYHFMRQLSNGEWYNKSGEHPGWILQPEHYFLLTADEWRELSEAYMASEPEKYPIKYNGGSIVIAINRGWCE